MEGETHDVQNDEPQYYNPLKQWLQTVKSSPKVSCCVTTSPSYILSKLRENYEAESEKMNKKVIISLSCKTLSSEYSQGTLQYTLRANGRPRFVFKLENQKDVYVASYVEDPSVYMIHLQRGESPSSSSSSHLVGKIEVSTLFSKTMVEREFVLFSNNVRIPHRRRNRGLSVHGIKNKQSISRLNRTSFVPDLCSWDKQFQEPNYDFEQVNLLENNLPTNLERVAVVVKQEFLEEEIGGWGLKFLKKSPLVQFQTNDVTKTETSTSLNVLIPSGIHEGPEDGPLSLIKRWKSQGNCDCGGWDLGCPLTLLKGQSREDQSDDIFVEFQESKHKRNGLRIMNVRGGLYLIQFQTQLSVLQSFSIALAYIHSQMLR